MSFNENLLTKEDALNIAKRFWNFELCLIDFKVQSYSNERLGFMSLHRSIKIKVEDTKNNKHSHTFFVKCLPPKDDPLAVCMTDMGVFHREVAFYRDVVPSLQTDFKELPWSPMSYGVVENAMILEDLRNRNFSLPLSKTLSYTEMQSLLSAIARMQSASMVAEKRLGKPLNEVYPEAFNLEPILKPDGFYRKWFQTGVNLVIHVADRLGLDTSKVQSTSDKYFEYVLPAEGKQNVITHSDLWSNNIMFDNQDPPKCVLIDFQWSRYCPPAQDVALVLRYCNDKKFRNEHMDSLLKFYYAEMTRILHLHGLKMFPWEEFLETIEEQTMFATLLVAICFPSIFMDGQVCEQMMSDPKCSMEFMFSDKRPVTMTLFEQGGEYEKKIREAVSEFVEMCGKSN